jgi:hypothetical protein
MSYGEGEKIVASGAQVGVKGIAGLGVNSMGAVGIRDRSTRAWGRQHVPGGERGPNERRREKEHGKMLKI